MAAGDNFFNCDDKLQLEQVIRQMIYDDGSGNPVLHTDPAGTTLDPWFDCDEHKHMTTEQVFRNMILEDADGNPYLNTTA